MTKFIDTKKWTFLKEGADDFRNGVPHCNEDELFSKKNNSVKPVLIGSEKSAKKSSKKIQRMHQSDQTADDNSRLTLIQRQRIKNVDAIEHILRQHPLALYPHFEECLPPELFEDVVSVLDPEITLVTDGNNTGDGAIRGAEERPAVYADPVVTDDETDYKTSDNNKVTNPYRWLPQTEGDEVDKKDKKSLAEQQRNFLKSEDEEHIKNVTQQFCDWVASLGGDANNIEESTITSLFASGYETKPALSVPIHVVELASVPPELRMSAASPAQSIPQQTGANKKLKQEAGGATADGKYQYGAWYLEPKIWKKRPVGEPMQDPDDTQGKDVSEAKQKSLDLDYDLAPMNGVKLFMDFVDKKDTRRPEFLDHVSEIQMQQQNEEQIHQEVDSGQRRGFKVKHRQT